MTTLSFPKNFAWGSATSSYQIEGASNEDGRSPSIWDTFCREPGRVHQQDNADMACDSYHRIAEDVALLKNMGATCYRFSVAWPRVIPTGRGAVNAAGLNYYVRLVDALLTAGIEPMVTLYHWDLPQCLQDEGGWENRQIAYDFVAYAEAVWGALGSKVKLWITINEPWCVAILSHALGIHAPGKQDLQASLTTAHHVLLAHGLAVQKFRALGLHGQIGYAPNVDWREPYSTHPDDLAACQRGMEWFNNWFLDPVYKGHYPAELLIRYAAMGAKPPIQVGDMAIINSQTDFLGINFYTGSYSQAAEEGDAVDPANPASLLAVNAFDVIGFNWTDFGWGVFPDAFYKVLIWLKDNYNNPPIYITENGACYNDGPDASGSVPDQRRISYYHTHLIAVHRAIRSGCDIRGYMAWSLMDNFEWAEGYSKRFGLVHVDFATLKRTPKASYHWYSKVIANNALDIDTAGRMVF